MERVKAVPDEENDNWDGGGNGLGDHYDKVKDEDADQKLNKSFEIMTIIMMTQSKSKVPDNENDEDKDWVVIKPPFGEMLCSMREIKLQNKTI